MPFSELIWTSLVFGCMSRETPEKTSERLNRNHPNYDKYKFPSKNSHILNVLQHCVCERTLQSSKTIISYFMSANAMAKVSNNWWMLKASLLKSHNFKSTTIIKFIISFYRFNLYLVKFGGLRRKWTIKKIQLQM